jgi:hypothetical protein
MVRLVPQVGQDLILGVQLEFPQARSDSIHAVGRSGISFAVQARRRSGFRACARQFRQFDGPMSVHANANDPRQPASSTMDIQQPRPAAVLNLRDFMPGDESQFQHWDGQLDPVTRQAYSLRHKGSADSASNHKPSRENNAGDMSAETADRHRSNKNSAGHQPPQRVCAKDPYCLQVVGADIGLPIRFRLSLRRFIHNGHKRKKSISRHRVRP